MDPDQIQLVRDSFETVAADAGRFSTRFYDRLFTVAPSVRPLFPDDLDEQREKLVRELVAIVDGVAELDRLRPRLRRLGALHVHYGAHAAHYDVVGAVLLDTLAEALGDAFTPDAREAWSSAITEVADAMLTGAREAVAGRLPSQTP